MSAFTQPLEAELERFRAVRVNALPSIVGERAAALRFRLERVDLDHCDGFTTTETPGYAAGVPIEVKSVRVDHHDGTGRVGIHPETHDRLVDEGGDYAIVVYGEREVDGARRIVVLDLDLVDVEIVDRYIPTSADGYQKVRWDLLLDDVDVDRARWSR